MKHELLAPAGNIEAGYAALYYGADAVYLGLNKFSARVGADNFNFEELNEFTAYAHSLKRKVFVALNTILTEEEIKDLPEMFAAIAKAKVDALIIQDLGVLYLAKKLLPEVELHASTQMAIHNVEGAKFLQSLGFKRVVLARELSLPEIKEIAETLPDLDLEVFVHGALCYSYSGQCMFSALEYGKSANRGRCVYPCRSLFDGDCAKTHLFSMKDLALEEDVLKLPALSLKIEGRKKSPLYVAAVTNYYRHILDGKKKDLKEAEDIKQIFSRPWCHFHLNNNKAKDIVDENFVGHRGLLIGKIEHIGKHKIGFKTAHTIAKHDGIQIDVRGDEKPFGFGIKELAVNGKRQIEAQKGCYVELELPDMRPRLTVGEPIYLSSASEVKGKYAYAKPKSGEYKNLMPLEVTVEIGASEIWALSEATAVSVKGEFTIAKDPEKVVDTVRKAFAKTGGTDYEIKHLTVHNPEKRFVPVSCLNELRRTLLENIVPEKRGFDLPEIKVVEKTIKAHQIKLFAVDLATTQEQISKVDFSGVWFVLPQICRNIKRLAKVLDMIYQAGARLFVVHNYYGFELLKKYKDIRVGAGSFLYVMNRYATESLKSFGAEWATPALESSPENMKILVENSALHLVQTICDFPPLFTSAVCIRRNDCKHCEGGTKVYNLMKDGREFTAISKDCQVQMFDNKPYERDLIDGMWGFVKETKRN